MGQDIRPSDIRGARYGSITKVEADAPFPLTNGVNVAIVAARGIVLWNNFISEPDCVNYLTLIGGKSRHKYVSDVF